MKSIVCNCNFTGSLDKLSKIPAPRLDASGRPGPVFDLPMSFRGSALPFFQGVHESALFGSQSFLFQLLSPVLCQQLETPHLAARIITCIHYSKISLIICAQANRFLKDMRQIRGNRPAPVLRDRHIARLDKVKKEQLSWIAQLVVAAWPPEVESDEMVSQSSKRQKRKEDVAQC